MASTFSSHYEERVRHQLRKGPVLRVLDPVEKAGQSERCQADAKGVRNTAYKARAQGSKPGPFQEKRGQNRGNQPELVDEAGKLSDWLDSRVAVSAEVPPQ